MASSRSCSRSGSALISTMLVLTILTIIVVAFLQSMTVERQTARSYLNRLRAELAAQAALSEATGRLAKVAETSKFHYAVSTENPNSATEYLRIIPKMIDSEKLDLAGAINLAVVPGEPGSAGTVDINLSPTDAPPAVKRTTAWKALLSPESEEVGRYSFWTSEGAGKQDVLVHSGAIDRGQLEDLRELPLVDSNGSPVSKAAATQLEPYQLFTTKTDRKNLFTTSTANQIINPTTRINDRDFVLNSPAAILTPEGKPRLNLTRLKVYLDGGVYQEQNEDRNPDNPGFDSVEYPPLSYKQGPTSPRFELIKQLLNEDGQYGAEKQNPWGPGNLEVVKKIFPDKDADGNYTQARQFVANLIDYIDEDLIPTTDGEPGPKPENGGATGTQDYRLVLATPPKAPTVLGVEARYENGGIRGHPYITYVGQGFIFNLNSGSSRVNSTRVLGWVGLAYPWDEKTDWQFGSNGGYQVEMQVGLGGTAEGTRGSTIPATSTTTGYFQANWLAQKSGFFKTGDDAVQTPGAFGLPHSYKIYPRAGAAGFDLANGWFTINQDLKDLKFLNLKTTIQTLRLIYNVPGTEPLGGPRFLVQDLSVLSNLPRDWNINPFKPTSSQYKLGGTYGQQDWHFLGDPRLNFRLEGWKLANTSGTNLSSGGSVASGPTGNATVAPSNGETNLYNAALNDRKDPEQGLKGDSKQWFLQDPGLANHFMVSDGARVVNPYPSPPADPPGTPAMHSFAELGFLHAGTPWQTLTLFNDPARFPSPDKVERGDWNLMDYVDLGIIPRRKNRNEQREITGQANVNTGQRNTLKALFMTIPSVPNPDSLIETLLGSPKRPFASPAAIFALETFKNNGATDPTREELAGRIYPALASHSQKFLVHCMGESRKNGKTLSRVHLVAEVELRYSSALSKIVPTILRTYYR